MGAIHPSWRSWAALPFPGTLLPLPLLFGFLPLPSSLHVCPFSSLKLCLVSLILW